MKVKKKKEEEARFCMYIYIITKPFRNDEPGNIFRLLILIMRELIMTQMDLFCLNYIFVGIMGFCL